MKYLDLTISTLLAIITAPIWIPYLFYCWWTSNFADLEGSE